MLSIDIKALFLLGFASTDAKPSAIKLWSSESRAKLA